MNSIEKRLKNIEKKVNNIYNYHGAFIILINNGVYEIQNKDIKEKVFNSKIELENYIYNTFNCEKYIFITFDITNIMNEKINTS